MKRFLILLGLIAFSVRLLLAADVPARFISDPALSPDGRLIVFSYENDLWKVPVVGGTAYRLTAMDGSETVPRFSPDGKWISFSAMADGNTNVYVMPANGGEIRQLTFHQSPDRVDSWSWDSQHIYFHSSRENTSSIYKVSPYGGTPKRVFGHYFNIPHHVVEHPHTSALIFTESMESLNQPQRKRYRGANRPDLLSYDLDTDVYKQLTDFEGIDMWPTIDSHGTVYFVSDEENGEYNLYTLVDGKKRALTTYETSIGRPQVSADGRKVVFEKDYKLFVYDVEQGIATSPDIQLFQSTPLSREQAFEVRGNISWFDVSPDNKKLAFVSRGELFVSDIEGDFVRHIPTLEGERVTEVVWAADNRHLFYIRTHNGWKNLFSVPADGKGAERMLEKAEANSRLLTLSQDRSKGVYLSGRNEVRVVDLEEFQVRTAVSGELWGFQNSVPRFSPDGRYILFTTYHHFEQNIMIHDLDDEKTIQLTNTGMSERMPYWSPCGKYIYFATDRYQPNYPRGNTRDRIYRIPLARIAAPLKSTRFDELFADKPESSDEDEEDSADIIIDMQAIEDRWEQMRISSIGRHWAPHVFSHGDHQLLFFTSNHDKGQWALWKLALKPFETSSPERIDGASPGMGLRMVEAGNSLYLLAGGDIQKLAPGGSRMEPIDLRHSFTRKLKDEFLQIFHEAWAVMDENFYADDFHGVDWASMRDRYGRHLPHVRTRNNLRRLVNDMLGELNASHTGFSSFGQEERTFFSARSADPGLVFAPDQPFVVEEVVRGSHLDLTEPMVMPGDILVEVNGRTVLSGSNRNRYFYFSHMPDELELTFHRGEETIHARMKPHTPGQVSGLQYDAWIQDNRRYVDKQTEGRVGYAFMKNMSAGALNQFIIDMSTHAREKEALILDIRFNTGGNVHDDVLQFLSQQPYMTWRYRGGKDAPQPNFAPGGNPIVLLINERSLSDAEMTAEGFRQLGLGTIVGTETYRWIIFTSGAGFVDGSSIRLPSWGCYSLEGENLELTGVAPDIDVYNTFQDRLKGRDPQLDRAIKEVLNEL